MRHVPSAPKVVHGDNLIYRFLRDLFTDEDAFGAVPAALLAATAVWFPLVTYRTVPVLAPYLVRDPTCRGGKGAPDEWSSPDERGFLRDDNSLIKGIPRALPIVAPAQKHLNGRRMATEFVAAHVWRVTADGGPLASRRPLLNSFVPNIVWLPRQIAKLTDLEGTVVQRTLQEMSWSHYRHVPVEDHLADVVEEAWSLLPEPTQTVHDSGAWNRFAPTDRFYATRRSNTAKVRSAVQAVLAGDELTAKVISTRYTEGLPTVSRPALQQLEAFLARFEP
jgi:hypothetical protein